LNLCRTEPYQGRGYYVSLLAEARGHRPMPEAKTISDLRAGQLGNLVSTGFRDQVQRALESYVEDEIEIEAFFGRDPLKVNDQLSQQLFGVLHSPLISARFSRNAGEWDLAAVRLLGATDIAPEQRSFVAQAATDFVARSRTPLRNVTGEDASLAILYDADEPNPPSNEQALENLRTAARELGMRVEFLRRSDIERVPEFDALFIRDTTSVSNFTYQFARRAAAEGLVVVDDPDSIRKCTNKVFLNELLGRHRVPVPKTLMVHRDNVDQIVPILGLPCVVKQPDSAFSLGVKRVNSTAELRLCTDEFFAGSDLLIAQEWLPTTFDWRVGVYDRRPLYVCKYYMAPGHWQVIKRETGRALEGLTQAFTVGEAPESVVKNAVRAANLIGDGFYGVDLKESGDQCYVMEINDNPNVDAGNEDGVLGTALYRELVGVLLRRARSRKGLIAQ
jgi:glutathione synthase/RimK-type ligase-like ATP-grasp enzyme